MRKFKRVAAFAMASAMVLSMAACGSNENGGESTSAQTDAEESKDNTDAAETKGNDETEADSTEGGDETATTGGAGTEIDNKALGTEYEECELTFSWWGGESRHDATLEAIAAFEEKYPGIKIVDPSYAAWDGWESKKAMQFTSGTAEDINQIQWAWISGWSSDGSLFVDLNDYSDVLDLSQFTENQKKQCTTAGELQGLPASMTGRIFYWDKTTFEEAGIEVPTSYEELLAAGNTFKEELGDDYYPIALGEYDRMILMVYYLESVYGKPWVENNELQYSQEEIVTGLEFLQEMEENHVTPTVKQLAGDGASSLDQNGKWTDGRYAGIFEWDSSAKKYADALANGRELVVGDYFSDWGDYQGGYSKVSLAFAISETCEHPKEAAMFLNFILNEKEGVEILNSQRGIPVSKSAVEYCNTQNSLDALTVEANGKVLSWVEFSMDPTFENANLKSSPDGAYYDAMAGLAYDDYSIDEAAEVLVKAITAELEANAAQE